MTPLEQLDLWVNDKSIHNSEREECCPDFSCCQTQFKAEAKVRKAFRKAFIENNKEVINAFLMGFLGNAIAAYDPNKDIYIADTIKDGEIKQ